MESGYQFNGEYINKKVYPPGYEDFLCSEKRNVLGWFSDFQTTVVTSFGIPLEEDKYVKAIVCEPESKIDLSRLQAGASYDRVTRTVTMWGSDPLKLIHELGHAYLFQLLFSAGLLSTEQIVNKYSTCATHPEEAFARMIEVLSYNNGNPDMMVNELNWRGGDNSLWYRKPIFSSIMEQGYPNVRYSMDNQAQLYYIYRKYGLDKMLQVINILPYKGNVSYTLSEYGKFLTGFKKITGLTADQVREDAPIWFWANASDPKYGNEKDPW